MKWTPEGIKKAYKNYMFASDRVRSKLLWFLKAPCNPKDCPHHLRYRHFTCLTCPVRRYQQQGTRSGFRQVKHLVVRLESISGKSFLLPKYYVTYGLIVKARCDGKAAPWKRIPLKILTSLAERIAEL